MSKPVVLVVDDEPQILRVMRASLPIRGYNGHDEHRASRHADRTRWRARDPHAARRVRADNADTAATQR